MISTRRQFCRSMAEIWAYYALSGNFACSTEQGQKEPERLERLAFGSCNKQDMVQSHWQQIASKDPQAWIWMGDAIYADETSPLERSLLYKGLLHNPYYKDFNARHLILGTWDDHDYAANDAGGEYPFKEASKKAFLDFIGEPEESERRLRSGIYASREIGTAGQGIQLILLDMRSFKPKAGREADPLGRAQWQWLEAEIKRPGPQLKIIVSSIQLLTDFTGRETWAIFPEAQTRLLKLLAESPMPLLVLSGDRHLSEISRRPLGDGRPLYELTASGLTHKSELTNASPWQLRSQLPTTNFGTLRLGWEQQSLSSVAFEAFSPQTGELLQAEKLSFVL